MDQTSSTHHDESTTASTVDDAGADACERSEFKAVIQSFPIQSFPLSEIQSIAEQPRPRTGTPNSSKRGGKRRCRGVKKTVLSRNNVRQSAAISDTPYVGHSSIMQSSPTETASF